MGAFVHGHYFIEPISDSGVPYVFALLVGVALGTWFGFYGPVQVPLEGVPERARKRARERESQREREGARERVSVSDCV